MVKGEIISKDQERTHSPLNSQVGFGQCLVAHLSQLLETMATKLCDFSGDKFTQFIESLKL